MPVLDSLQNLSIDCNDHYHFTRTVLSLHHILSHTPNLRHLTLLGLDLDITAPGPIYQSQIDKLSLPTKYLVHLKSFTVRRSSIDGQYGEIEFFSKWFSYCTCLEACFIELGDGYDHWDSRFTSMTPRNLMLALAPTRQTLRHLSLDIDDLGYLGSTDIHISVRQLAQFTKLETLRLSIGCMWAYDPSGLNLADAIPVTLRKIALIFNAHNVDESIRAWRHLTGIVDKVRAGEAEMKLQQLVVEFDEHYTMETVLRSHLVAIKRALAGTSVTVEVKLCGVSILPSARDNGVHH